TSSFTPAISSDVAELKDMVRALLLDKKNQSSASTSSLAPAPVKAVEPNYVTCGGTHSYKNFPATSRNAYRDNIQEYVSQATATNYNQGNTGFRPQMEDPPEVPMADNQTMAQLLQAPTVGACPHHGFSKLHQIDTFYNALNVNYQFSLNSVAGGIFLDKMSSECLKIIERKSKVRQSRAKAVVAKVNSNSSTPAISSDVAELKDMVRALLLDKKNQSSAPAPSPTPALVKAVEPNCVTYGGTHSYQNCPATSGNVYQDNIQEYVSQAAAANYSQGNTGFRP
nr:hypothetical protein [Tanacetum cinerariifolium]